MSVNNFDDVHPLSSGLDEVDSPRKRMRIESPARKSWSLTDRKTDQEVLQEMGVSFLDSDENEQQCETETVGSPLKPNLKRKHDIENVNPNVNSITSPRSKFSPRSPRGKICSPSPGPSKAKSPRSCEKSKPLQPTDLESTLLHDYVIEEETPMGQSVAVAPRYLPASPGQSPLSIYTEDTKDVQDRDIHKDNCQSPIAELQLANYQTGVDSFSVLSDEMMLSVFRWLPKRTLAHCMLVCKRWHRVACDETLWQRLDLGNKTLNKNALGRILGRLPVIVRLASSEISEWHPSSPPEQSRVQYLDLSMSTVDPRTLDCLLERCGGVKKLSLESIQVRDSTCQLIGKCSNLETLNLTMAQGVTAEGLTAILEGCVSLQSLNISWCNLSEAALTVLVSNLPEKLQRLNLGGARIMTDDMVATLCSRGSRLLELDLSDCSRLGARAVAAVACLPRLEHLALSRCYLLPPHVLTKLSSMPSLQYLEVWGMLQTASLSALRAALPAIQVNQFMFSAIARPTVGARRTSIWGLRTRD
ncbi:S-phase kinase-associated protein 2-like [Cydia pomonella]|uniref:S-phase kinase-associated protein 2-like n=1 Tax=Cydia pomonella TaxID=82600 RepID=UPI002ADD7839|nr:S-phase kinase-associated protein 2-like [Cydia pomonella]